jgi:hypothetical protein
MNKRTIAITLSSLTTLVSLVFMGLLAFRPDVLLPHSLHSSDSSSFIGSFALARALPLSLGFAWVVYNRKDQLLSGYLWILALVQLGDVLISLIYGNVGGMVGPMLSVVIYVLSALAIRETSGLK